MKKLLLIIVLLIFLFNICRAQNDIQFSNYMFSEISYNPAMAGNTGTLDATLLARQQWIGFDKSPQTQLFSIHSFVKKVQGGLGLSIINDKLGYEHSLNVKLMYAYQIHISDKSKLSLGLGFGMLNKYLHGSQLTFDDMTDPYGVYNDVSKTKPDFDFGIAFNSQKLNMGISATHISQSSANSTVFNASRHYYLYAEYKIKASDRINIIPSINIRRTIFITQADISTIIYYANKFWIGTSFRQGNAVIGLAGIDITKNIRIGYSYDYSIGAIKSYSNGSHEVVLIASFDVSKNGKKNPRFFN